MIETELMPRANQRNLRELFRSIRRLNPPALALPAAIYLLTVIFNLTMPSVLWLSTYVSLEWSQWGWGEMDSIAEQGCLVFVGVVSAEVFLVGAWIALTQGRFPHRFVRMGLCVSTLFLSIAEGVCIDLRVHATASFTRRIWKSIPCQTYPGFRASFRSLFTTSRPSVIGLYRNLHDVQLCDASRWISRTTLNTPSTNFSLKWEKRGCGLMD